MNAVVKTIGKTDFHVADLSLADWGRKEIRIAETEMPGLMAIREEYAPTQPLRGARITGDTSAAQRLRRGIFLADRHQARHFGLGDTNFLTAPIGQGEIGDVEVGLADSFDDSVHGLTPLILVEDERAPLNVILTRDEPGIGQPDAAAPLVTRNSLPAPPCGGDCFSGDA